MADFMLRSNNKLFDARETKLFVDDQVNKELFEAINILMDYYHC